MWGEAQSSAWGGRQNSLLFVGDQSQELNDVGPEVLPHWDGRDLMFEGDRVKRFKRIAPRMTAILDAFRASGWSHMVPDPFPNPQGLDYSDRLHQAVGDLNRSLDVKGVIRFGVRDGHVYWEVV